MAIRLAVVDAAQVIRAGIRDIVSTTETIVLVGDWDALNPFLDYMANNTADVLLLGDNVSRSKPKVLVQMVRDQHPKLKLVILAARFTASDVDQLLKRGATGFMYKDEALGEFFVSAIGAVKRGDVYISPHTASTLFLTDTEQQDVSLSPYQMQVLEYMSQYKTPQEIAQMLKSSPSSIYNVQKRIRVALGVLKNEQVLIEAAKLGLLQDKDSEKDSA